MLRRLLASLMIATLTLSAPAAFAASAFTDKQRAELETIIKDVITKNPQVLIASVEAHYNKETEVKKAQEGRMEAVPANMVDANTPTVGPKDGLLVVEFFDYNCGYCKQVTNDVQRLIDNDKNVRVVFKELPILSETSEVAARYALAANKQGKYLPYHTALMNHQGPLSEEFLVDTAKSQGLDVEKLKKDANSQEFRDALNKNMELARTLGIRGTPFFVIGKEKVPGALGYTNMTEIIAQERGEKPAAATETKTDAAAPAATAPVAADSSTQAEIDKAKAEAQAMINELKAEAEKMQKDAMDQQQKLRAQAEKEEAKAKAEAAAKKK